jgi:hypothetical protein
LTWTNVLEQERVALEQQDALPQIANMQTRPFLDGRGDEAAWTYSASLPLTPSWTAQTNGTTIRFAHDQEFLYIYCNCPSNAFSSTWSDSASKSKPSRQKSRDTLSDQSDQLRLRLDLDRDYSTWFEFAWSPDGETFDQCTDMPGWNPKWFVACDRDAHGWSSEVAIPLNQIGVDAQWLSQPWALSAVRCRPSMTHEALPAGSSDRWSNDQWLIMQPER